MALNAKRRDRLGVMHITDEVHELPDVEIMREPMLVSLIDVAKRAFEITSLRGGDDNGQDCRMRQLKVVGKCSMRNH